MSQRERGREKSAWPAGQAIALAGGLWAATALLVRQTSSGLSVAADGAAVLEETARLLGIIRVGDAREREGEGGGEGGREGGNGMRLDRIDQTAGTRDGAGGEREKEG